MFLSVPPAPVNKTNTAGNVYITTDHNEVVVFTAQVTKTALAEIKSTLDYLNPPRGGGGTPYNGLYGKASPERGTFFRLQVYKRVGKSSFGY